MLQSILGHQTSPVVQPETSRLLNLLCKVLHETHITFLKKIKKKSKTLLRSCDTL